MRWNTLVPCDPIADIRRAAEMQERRVAQAAQDVAFGNKRLAALSAYAKARAASMTAELHASTCDASDSVWLCDEYGILPTPIDTSTGQQIAPLRVPRKVAEFLGAEFREGMAYLRLAVPAPEKPDPL